MGGGDDDTSVGDIVDSARGEYVVYNVAGQRVNAASGRGLFILRDCKTGRGRVEIGF